jgi:Velvet factor
MVRSQVNILPVMAVYREVLILIYGRYYSLEVVQHPVRARMCGFGDKVRESPSRFWLSHLISFHIAQDRRPLAPAAVCKMIVRREDNSIVEEE